MQNQNLSNNSNHSRSSPRTTLSFVDKLIVLFTIIKWLSCVLIDWQLGFDLPLTITDCNQCILHQPVVVNYYGNNTLDLCRLGCQIRSSLGLNFQYYLSNGTDVVVEENDLAFQGLNLTSSITNTPFYILIIYGILKKKEWIRIPAICSSYTTLYVLFAYFLATLPRSTRPMMVILANSPWIFGPLLTIYRMLTLIRFDQSGGYSNKAKEKEKKNK